MICTSEILCKLACCGRIINIMWRTGVLQGNTSDNPPLQIWLIYSIPFQTKLQKKISKLAIILQDK